MKQEAINSEQLHHLAERAELYSVTFAFLKDLNKKEDYVRASGVLLELKGHYFILSAGHVVQLVDSHGAPYISVAKSFHIFKPQIVQHRFIYQGNDDRGFIELAPTDAKIMESRNKVFASSERIFCVNPNVLKQQDAALFLFGFPDYYAKKFNQPFLLFSKILDDNRPPELLAADDNHIDLRIDRSQMILFNGTEVRETPPEALGGASGAGLWHTVSNSFRPEDIELVGIATFHSQKYWTEGSSDIGFVRTICIDKVLALIGEAYPELKSDIDGICLKEKKWGDIHDTKSQGEKGDFSPDLK